MVWCFCRQFIPSPSGRKRFNILAAMNAVTLEVLTVTNTTYINATSVCQLLKQIDHLCLEEPVTLVMDNARYQKCQWVQFYAEQLGIELLYLPAYSPHLNLIERLWKLVKRQCLYSKYYETFELFQEAIELTMIELQNEKFDRLKSTMTWSFQSFKKVLILSV